MCIFSWPSISMATFNQSYLSYLICMTTGILLVKLGRTWLPDSCLALSSSFVPEGIKSMLHLGLFLEVGCLGSCSSTGVTSFAQELPNNSTHTMGKTVTSFEKSFQAHIKCRQIPPTEPLFKKISNTPIILFDFISII